MVLQIFAEGFDIKFLSDFTTYIGLPIDQLATNNTEGWTKLKNVKQKFFEATNKQVRNGIIFDANGDIEQRRTEIEAERERLGINFELFLLPNNNNVGCFENLLLQLVQPDKQNIVDCFDSYVDCVQAINPHIQIPIKSKVFAFLEATGQPLKISEVNFLNHEFWDLDHPALNPLRDFINGLVQ